MLWHQPPAWPRRRRTVRPTRPEAWDRGPESCAARSNRPCAPLHPMSCCSGSVIACVSLVRVRALARARVRACVPCCCEPTLRTASRRQLTPGSRGTLEPSRPQGWPDRPSTARTHAILPGARGARAPRPVSPRRQGFGARGSVVFPPAEAGGIPPSPNMPRQGLGKLERLLPLQLKFGARRRPCVPFHATLRRQQRARGAGAGMAPPGGAAAAPGLIGRRSGTPSTAAARTIAPPAGCRPLPGAAPELPRGDRGGRRGDQPLLRRSASPHHRGAAITADQPLPAAVPQGSSPAAGARAPPASAPSPPGELAQPRAGPHEPARLVDSGGASALRGGRSGESGGGLPRSAARCADAAAGPGLLRAAARCSPSEKGRWKALGQRALSLRRR